MASRYFDWPGFKTYYLNSSKYSKKEQLLNSFYNLWADTFGVTNGLGHLCGWGHIKSYFTAQNKKKLKIQLQGWGYSPAGIDGLYKSFSQWLKANM